MTWDRERRVIVNAEHLDNGSNTRFVVTDLEDTPQAIFDGLYAPRPGACHSAEGFQDRRPGVRQPLQASS